MKQLTTKELISAAKTYVAEAEDDRIREECEANRPVSLDFLKNQLPGWRRFYLKKNQPKNYFRVTKLTTIYDGVHVGIYKFQIWIKGALADEHRTTLEAYTYFASHPHWDTQEDQPNFFVYRPQLKGNG